MKKTGTYLLAFGALSFVFFAMCAICLFIDYGSPNKILSAFSSQERTVIVIDPGHGGEDGGCVSESGILEKDLNLVISNKLKNILSASGYEILLTREEDKMLYDMYGDMTDYKGKKKLFDLKNRIKFAKECSADMFVSIHMNKFPVSKYKGLQVYYSPNNDKSELLARAVKENNTLYLQPDNEREIKAAGTNIFVLNRLNIPAILVECGFLSNAEETALLCDEDYRNKLALVVATSLMKYNES